MATERILFLVYEETTRQIVLAGRDLVMAKICESTAQCLSDELLCGKNADRMSQQD